MEGGTFTLRSENHQGCKKLKTHKQTNRSEGLVNCREKPSHLQTNNPNKTKHEGQVIQWWDGGSTRLAILVPICLLIIFSWLISVLKNAP